MGFVYTFFKNTYDVLKGVYIMDDNKGKSKNHKEEVDSMRTLQEIREINSRKDLLLVGMENKPVSVPLEVTTEEKKVYATFVKPNVHKIFDFLIKKER